MGVRFRRACLAGIGALGVVLAASCQEPTAIEIEVRASFPASELSGVTFTVGAPGATENGPIAAATNEARNDGRNDTFVGTLVVIPGSSDDASVWIKIVAGVGGVRPEQCNEANAYRGCIVARRSLRYRPHVRLRLPIRLDATCRDVPCDALSTCGKGSCVSSTVQCSGDGCALPGELTFADDGGLAFVDAPTDPDAYVQVDASDASSATDASDSGTTNSGSTPGLVKCGLSPCSVPGACCAYPGQTVCVSNATACPLTSFRAECDGAEDCPTNNSCCSFGTRIGCSTQPCAPKSEICKSDLDCHNPAEHCTNMFAVMYGGCQ